MNPNKDGWKTITMRILAGIAIITIVVSIGGYCYLRSSGFHQWAIRKIVQEANEATGGHTEIKSLDFELSSLTAHLYGIVVRGQEPAGTPPLLEVDKLTVGLKIQSILHRKINLSELLIERPVVRLAVDRQGHSNIPKGSKSNSGSYATAFDLAVRHLALVCGEVNYNDKKIPIDADLHDLSSDLTFDSLSTRYRGSFSYEGGHLHYGEYQPVVHALAVKFSATPSELTVDSAVMRVASSTLSVQAELTNYSDPTVSGKYDLRVHTPDLAAMNLSVKSTGDMSLTGDFRFHSDAGETFLRGVAIDGKLAGEKLIAKFPGGRVELNQIQAKYRISKASLVAEGIEAELLDGRLDGAISIENLDESPKARFRSALHGISLQAIQTSVRQPGMNRVAIAGTIDGTLNGYWTGNVGKIHAQSDLSIRSPKGWAVEANAVVPIDGVIHAIYDAPNQTLTLHQTKLSVPSTVMTADGQLSKQSRLQIHATCVDLHQLALLASAFQSDGSAPTAVSGLATVDAVVKGTIRRPEISGYLSGQNLHAHGSEWKSASATFQADPSRVFVSEATLASAQRGSASGSATIALHDWSYLPANSIQAKLSIRQISLDELEHLVAVQYPVSGELSANISFSGSQLDPGGSGSVEVRNACVYDEPLQTLSATFHAAGGSITSHLNVVLEAGSANADLNSTPRTKSYKVRLDVPSLSLQKLHAVKAKNLNVMGTLSISADGSGTIDNPQLTASIQLPKLDLGGKHITGTTAEVHVANQSADLIVSSQIAQASVRARGHVALTGDYETEASIDTGAVPLDVLLATFTSGVSEGFQGQTEFHATLKGPLKDKTRMEAHLTVPTLTASYQTLQIGLAAPMHVDYAHSIATLQPVVFSGTGTQVNIQGTIPLSGTSSPNLSAQGSVDARILRIVSPDIRSSGVAVLDVHATGSATNPELRGQIRLQNVALVLAGAPLSVDKLNGTLDMANDRVQISSMTAEVGGGQLSVGGSIAYRPSLQFNVAVQADSIRLRYPDGLRTVLDANLALSGNMQASTLNGRVLMGALSFTPDFDLATVADQFSAVATAPAQPGFADTVNLQVAVQSKDNLSATSSQVSLEGTANLRVTGTAANPVITGRTDLTSGEFFYRNVRYQLQHGLITFENPNQTAPVLNVAVSTTVEQYNLTLNLRGPFDMLVTSYVSDPPLATADIINLIARGKTSSELAASQSTDSMIASQAASQISGSVQKLAGLSSLQIDPLIGGNNQNPSARVAIQQRVSKNFLFTFSTDVSQPGSEVVQGDYQINKRWSVSVARDQVGGISIDGRYHTKF